MFSTDPCISMPFGGENRRFHDPFLLPSSYVMPTDHQSVMDFALFLFYMNPGYMKAAERTTSYFVTDLKFDTKKGGVDERNTHLEFLKDQMGLLDFLIQTGNEYACYGNAFPWIYFPFDRVLVDMRHRGRPAEWALDQFGDLAKFHLTQMKYEVPDPRRTDLPMDKRPKVMLPFIDRPSRDRSRIRLRLLDPRQITLIFSELPGTVRVCYRFRPDFVRQIKEGVLAQVNTTPVSMLKAIRLDHDYLFNDKAVFHMKAPTISGISNSGWGLPGPIANFRALFQMQVYRKIDEAVALDYMLPFRIMTPKLSENSTGSDIDMLAPLWMKHMGQIIKDRRQDPFAMHSLPFPVNYMESNANGRILSPKDSMLFQKNEINENAGYPVELWQGTMQVQAMPVALRLFENSFFHIHRGLDRCARWINEATSRHLDQEQLDLGLKLPSTADDLEARSVMIQLAASGEVSRERAFKFLNIDDPVTEQKRRLEEDLEIERARAQQERQLEKEFMSGTLSAGAGSEPSGQAGTGGPQVTPGDIQQQAQQYAEQAVQSDPGSSSRLLRYLMNTNPQLHALTKEFMERIKRQQGSAAVAQLRQPQQG